MKRVLCILSSLDAGGAETFLMKVSRILSPQEYQLDFVVSAEDGCYTQEVLDRGGKIFFVPMRTKDLIGAFKGLRKIVSENQYKYVLKLGNAPISVVDLLAAKLGGAKVLAMRSCNAAPNPNFKQKLQDALFRPLLNGIANVKLAPSDLAAQYTFGKKQYEKGNVFLLNNGVDLDVYHFDPEGRQRIRRELSVEDKLVIGHVGRLSRQKNHPFILEVFQQIAKKRQDAVLLLVGKGELEQKIRDQAAQLGLQDQVIFAGTRSDIPQVLSAMDVFILPSFYEGMPNTVIEAQSTGLPCVISDTITRTADITGIVHYLPLTAPAQAWAEKLIELASLERMDTKQAFLRNRYDIQSASRDFVEQIFDCM